MSGRRSGDFITGREHKKKKEYVSVGGGVMGRSEDFITEREHTKIN